MTNEKLFKVPVGDWSDDGHGKCENYYVEANYSAIEMRQAYKDTCKKIGLQLHYGEDYTGIKNMERYNNWRYLLSEYEQSSICEEAVEILLNHGFEFSRVDGETDENDNYLVQEAYFSSEGVFDLFMWFIKYSMPSDFEYKQVTLDAEPIVGYWNKELNHQVGYGVFY
ncbi:MULTISPECIES: hypothetical protein [Lysinibacillus]|uniref:hypothetical protein n=1 Tax=Lysinibacillus TaxID=400634 RepID=UPI00214B42EA|nr:MULTISPECIES: hypothetical protein [Lysinibacillus]UUV25979.1 hypothetical protein NP781_04990 [Lysinibacillus sp. FN11]UYB48852.1 hypothetical protein OCI51_07780 [Lysinibacillus capsici]